MLLSIFSGPKLQKNWLSAKIFVDAMKEADYFSTKHACTIDVTQSYVKK